MEKMSSHIIYWMLMAGLSLQLFIKIVVNINICF